MIEEYSITNKKKITLILSKIFKDDVLAIYSDGKDSTFMDFNMSYLFRHWVLVYDRVKKIVYSGGAPCRTHNTRYSVMHTKSQSVNEMLVNFLHYHMSMVYELNGTVYQVNSPCQFSFKPFEWFLSFNLHASKVMGDYKKAAIEYAKLAKSKTRPTHTDVWRYIEYLSVSRSFAEQPIPLSKRKKIVDAIHYATLEYKRQIAISDLGLDGIENAFKNKQIIKDLRPFERL